MAKCTNNTSEDSIYQKVNSITYPCFRLDNVLETSLSNSAFKGWKTPSACSKLSLSSAEGVNFFNTYRQKINLIKLEHFYKINLCYKTKKNPQWNWIDLHFYWSVVSISKNIFMLLKKKIKLWLLFFSCKIYNLGHTDTKKQHSKKVDFVHL